MSWSGLFPNWTGWKTTKGVLFVLVGVLPQLVPADQVPLTNAIVALVGALVVFLSGTGIGPEVTKRGGGKSLPPPGAGGAGGAGLGAAAAFAMVLAGTLLLACHGSPSPVVPVATLTECVASVVATNPGAPVWDLLVLSIADCGGDVASILDQLTSVAADGGATFTVADVDRLRAQRAADAPAFDRRVRDAVAGRRR